MIIFINGSINAGKTTVAKILAQKLSNTALLEVDELRKMIEWMSIDQSIPINLKNLVSLIENFSQEGLNVVVPYPLSEKNYNFVIENLKSINTKIYAFTLSPKLEKILKNRGSRELNNLEKERIKYHYDIGIQSPSFGEIIDNSEQTPEETANYIIGKIKI